MIIKSVVIIAFILILSVSDPPFFTWLTVKPKSHRKKQLKHWLFAITLSILLFIFLFIAIATALSNLMDWVCKCIWKNRFKLTVLNKLATVPTKKKALPVVRQMNTLRASDRGVFIICILYGMWYYLEDVRAVYTITSELLGFYGIEDYDSETIC